MDSNGFAFYAGKDKMLYLARWPKYFPAHRPAHLILATINGTLGTNGYEMVAPASVVGSDSKKTRTAMAAAGEQPKAQRRSACCWSRKALKMSVSFRSDANRGDDAGARAAHGGV